MTNNRSRNNLKKMVQYNENGRTVMTLKYWILFTFLLCFQTLAKLVFYTHTWNFSLYNLVTKMPVFKFQTRKRPQILSRPTYGELDC